MTSRHGTRNLGTYPHVQDMTGGSSSSRSSTRFPRGLLLAMLEFRMLNQPFPVGVTMSLFSFVFFANVGKNKTGAQ